MIKISTLLFATIFMALGAIPTFYGTMEYAQLRADAKPAQDRAILADLGYDIPNHIDSTRYAVIGN
jgi:hypothetical protein